MVAIDMAFPKRCEDCRFWEKEEAKCTLERCYTLRIHGHEKPSWCPLFEIPEECAGCEELVARRI